jgi:hypothetical protein
MTTECSTTQYQLEEVRVGSIGKPQKVKVRPKMRQTMVPPSQPNQKPSQVLCGETSLIQSSACPKSEP